MRLSKENILNVLKENKHLLEKEMGVKRIGLFGSYAQGLEHADSDVDIFLEFSETDYKKILRALLFLEDRLKNKVDLVYKGSHLRSSFLQTPEKETIYA